MAGNPTETGTRQATRDVSTRRRFPKLPPIKHPGAEALVAIGAGTGTVIRGARQIQAHYPLVQEVGKLAQEMASLTQQPHAVETAQRIIEGAAQASPTGTVSLVTGIVAVAAGTTQALVELRKK